LGEGIGNERHVGLSVIDQFNQKNQPVILPPALRASARRFGFAINRLKPIFAVRESGL
jgi:hypothetical protein